MKLFIPACGDRLTLVEPWTFDLYLESRNMKFAETHGALTPKEAEEGRYGGVWTGESYASKLKHVPVTLPTGTVLECDRVYIRTFSKSAIQVGDDFDSITWKVMKGDKPARNSRFWCKLPDVYNIEYELSLDSLYRDRIKAFKEVHES
jgi:hypothetical protein